MLASVSTSPYLNPHIWGRHLPTFICILYSIEPNRQRCRVSISDTYLTGSKRRQTNEHQRKDLDQREQNEDNCIYSHAFGRSICHSDRAKHHRHWNVPSLEHSVLRHHCHLGKRSHFCDCPGLLRTVWHGRALWPAS